MNIYIPLAILFILFALLTKTNRKVSNVYFTIMMVISMIFAAIRFEFGPDYFQYQIIYDKLNELGVEGYLDVNEHIERLFLYFLYSFPSYYLFIAVQSILWFGSIYLFLRNRVDTRYLWLVIFLLYFDVNNILNNYVAIRTSLVGILFIVGLSYLKKNRIIYILFIVLAFFIHSSSAPLLLLALVNGKKDDQNNKNKYIYIRNIVIIIGVISFLLGDVISGPITDYLINLFPNTLGKYSYYMEDMYIARSVSLGNFVFLAMRVFIVIMLVNGLKKETEYEYVLFYKIAIIMSMLSVLLGNMLTSRLNMNVAPLLIVIYLRTLKYINKDWAILFVSCLICISLFSFYNYLQSESAITFLEYHSIIGQ